MKSLGKIYINNFNFKLNKFSSYNFVVNYYKKVRNPDKIYKYRRYDEEGDKDKEEFQRQLKESRKQITETYWKEQSKIEAGYFKDFKEIQEREKIANQITSFEFIVAQSWKCAKDMHLRKLAHDRFYAKQNVWRLEDAAKSEENQALLSLIDREAEHWLTPQNFYQNISSVIDEILPHTIISHRDYYNKVNKYALLMDKGMVESAENLKNNSENSEFKNKLLEPIFTNLKKMIRHLSKNPEHVYLEKYTSIKNKLENHYDITKGEGKIIHDKFKDIFTSLIEKQRILNDVPNNKINLIEKTLTSLINITITWNKYIEVLYMTDEEISKLNSGNGVDTREIDLLDDKEINEKLEENSKEQLVGDDQSKFFI